MLEFLEKSIIGDTFSISSFSIIILVCIIIGFVISKVYIYTHKKSGYISSIPITLIMLPPIIAIIIMLVGNNVARAFSIAGAFTIIRYRSIPSDVKDIAFVFFTLATGLGCGLGYVGISILFTIIMCILIFILYATKYSYPKATSMTLKITIPEDLNYKGFLDDILEKYTNAFYLKRVKTIDFGALFEVVYIIQIKPDIDQKEFIDEIRCRNGNLTVALTLNEFQDIMFN